MPASLSLIKVWDNPTTAEGRFVAVGLMLAGVALLGVVTAAVAAWFVERVQLIEAAELHTASELNSILAELRIVRRQLDALGAASPPPADTGAE